MMPTDDPKLRLAVIANGDPLDVNLWSGTPLHMVEALRPLVDFVHIEPEPWAPWFTLLRRAAMKFSGGKLDIIWSRTLTRLGSSASRGRVVKAAPDATLVISNSALGRLLGHQTRTINLADTTGPSILNYYPEINRLSTRIKQRIVSFSKDNVSAAFLNSYPSFWARDSAIEDIGVPAERAVQIAWGANFKQFPQGSARQLSSPARLLFVGIDWLRKGGPQVVEAVRLLREKGVAVQLDVVGYRPETETASDGVTYHGRLYKNRTDHLALLESLYQQAHLFVLPTLYECLGIVFCEAAAYGLPSVSLRTGGVPSVVKDGETGLLLDVTASPADLADAIAGLIGDAPRYEAMSRAVLADSHERLNWDAWSHSMIATIRQRLAATGKA
ncbi:glycosyltransferase family 4 protein [Novosphingobium rosa]|uniref:glycosyltransferase family 4 protein n=1 Tax=Novosphingobium rosa TaxID=76978 RepID=UPI00082FA7F1|nr:glycosyltransferase family 4 protein [Novosphingobium rosa]